MTDRTAPADPPGNAENGPREALARALEAEWGPNLVEADYFAQKAIYVARELELLGYEVRGLAARQDEPSPALRARIEALRVELVERIGMQYGDGRKPDLTLLVIEAVEAALAANPPQTRECAICGASVPKAIWTRHLENGCQPEDTVPPQTREAEGARDTARAEVITAARQTLALIPVVRQAGINRLKAALDALDDLE